MTDIAYDSRPVRVPNFSASLARPRRVSILTIAPVVAIVYSFLLFPIETGIYIGSASLPIYRILLIASLPIILVQYFNGRFFLNGPDYCILLCSLWAVSSFVVVYGPAIGMTRGIPIVIDIGVSYFLARTCITSFNDVRSFFLLILPGILVVAAMMAVESVGGRILVRPFFASIFGSATRYEGGIAAGALEYREHIRMGLLRVGATFSHPILAGAFFASTLPLWWMSHIKSWPRYFGIAASFACIFTISSAAFLAFALGLAMVIADRGMRYVPKIGWPLILAIIFFLVLALELGSKNGAASIIARNTIDPHTAYYRLLIWEYGSQTVAENPWFGIGYDVYNKPDWMTSSVDAHFLNLAIRHGLAMPLFLLIAIFWSMISLGAKTRFLPRADRDLAVGLNFVLAMLVLVAFTVAYFGESGIWFSILIGIGASLAAQPAYKVNYAYK